MLHGLVQDHNCSSPQLTCIGEFFYSFITPSNTHIGWQGSHKHVTSTVSNGKRDLGIHQNALRGNPACVKDRNLIVSDFNDIPPLWVMNVGNSNGGGAAYRDGSTVRVGVFGSYLHVLGNFQGRDRFHGYDHVAFQGPCVAALEIGFVHGDILSLLGALQGNPRV